jgi:hypothetical protein
LVSLLALVSSSSTSLTGIPAQVIDIGQQLCFGIDYDFGSHKCYFHVDNSLFRICPSDGSQPLTPRDLVANPAVVNILLCEYLIVYTVDFVVNIIKIPLCNPDIVYHFMITK